MSEKWFNNHGQAVGTLFAIGSFFVALLANWNAIREHQDLLAWWPVIIMPLAVSIAFRVGRSSQPIEQPTGMAAPEPEKSPPKPSMPAPSLLPVSIERFELDYDRLTIAKQTVKLGDFWQLGGDLDRLKIAPLSFQPLRKDVRGVDIRFDTQGSVFYGGLVSVVR